MRARILGPIILLLLACAVTGLSRSFDRTPPAERTQDVLKADSTRHTGALGAFARSVVVPGWGQSWLKQPEKGRFQFYLDLGLATLTVGLVHFAGAKEDEYMSYAQQVAGADRKGRNSDYWVNVSKYDSRAAYNEAMLRANRPDRRYLDPADDWNWPGRDQRGQFRNTRALSEDAYSQALAAGGAILLNHLISGVHALKLAGDPAHSRLSAFQQNGRLGLALALD
ncbi:MAG: hypothetical protein KDC10_03310 [Calditrichaeota bacterium]|nr:hypothetical protein [Candidatus Cloacimonadota bacterium]MCA9787855.1 hypothetical protein [Candidatus Cloacimonadota bacterium]MCB1046206.1 hypothetical protein [Calditrichota bacterium]MCB9473093.1 hypothetical protein [Candidatus Delongbacteria bacterium]